MDDFMKCHQTKCVDEPKLVIGEDSSQTDQLDDEITHSTKEADHKLEDYNGACKTTPKAADYKVNDFFDSCDKMSSLDSHILSLEDERKHIADMLMNQRIFFGHTQTEDDLKECLSDDMFKNHQMYI